MYDEEHDAQRVKIVSGDIPDIKVDIDPSSITNAIQKGLESFKGSSNEPQLIQKIEVPVIVKEIIIEKVEVPVIIKEIEIKEIKIPYEVIKVIEIEKPVLIKEQLIQVVEKATMETMSLRIAVVALICIELLTLLLKK